MVEDPLRKRGVPGGLLVLEPHVGGFDLHLDPARDLRVADGAARGDGGLEVIGVDAGTGGGGRAVVRELRLVQEVALLDDLDL